ncbi:ABC transporter substrate-binding protein [Caproicibacterium sp. NSD3]
MKRIVAAILALTMLFSLTACGNSSGSGGSGSTASTASTNVGKTDIVIGTAAEAVTLDPQNGWDGNSLYVMRQMYNGLVKLDNNMKIVGDLAESWKTNSDTSVTFSLKHGVKFHNGDEMKASDVVFSIERAENSAKVKTFAADIASVVADDDYTVTINTKTPYAPLMSNLCHTACSIVSEKAAKAEGDKFSAAPVGTGPFKFSEWDSGDKIILSRNDNYFGGKVLPSSLTFKLMTDGSARNIALETGDIDMNLIVSASDAARFENESSVKLISSMSPKIEYVSMNQKVTPFNNQKVREAINYAIDRDSLNSVATAGYGKVTDSVMNQQILGYSDEVTHYDYNPEKAKAFLSEAGYPNGFSTSILVYGDSRNTEAQLIQANLKDVGITLTVTSEESTTMLDQINSGNYDMFIMSYNNTTGDPDTSLYMLFDSQIPAASGNRSYTNIPDVDKMLDEARVETDNTKRIDLYANIQKTLAEQAVWVPLYNVPNLVGVRSGLTGYTPHPLGNDVYDQLCYQ